MQNHFKVAQSLVKLLENQFSIFGFKFGLDPILGVIPWFGDAVSAILSLYIVWIAKQAKVPQHKLSEMFRNVVLDFILGVIPIVGDVTDFFYKANTKNLEILREYMASEVIDGEYEEEKNKELKNKNLAYYFEIKP